MSHVDPEVTLADNLEKPKKGENNMGIFEQHNLKDQIKVVDRISANKAMTSSTWGLGLKKFNTPGTA